MLLPGVTEDPLLRAVLGAVHPLPGVHAGSALLAVGTRLLAIRDDAWNAAWIDLPGLAITPLPLRTDQRVLKKHEKPDFEAAVQTRGRIHMLGSGSAPNRCVVASFDIDKQEISVREHHPLYSLLQQALQTPNRLNIEGAAVRAGRLLLLHRGSGSAASALIELPLASLEGGKPEVLAVHWFQIGSIDNVALTFTDCATLTDERLVFVAAAERSDNPIDDGPVAGSAVGLIDFAGNSPERIRWTRVVDADSGPSRRKFEGIVPDTGLRGAWLLTDPDRTDQLAELCRIELSGF